MSLAGEMMTLTGKITSQFAVGSSIGSMILPWLIGLFFETSGPPSMAVVLLVNMMIALVVLLLLAQTTAPRKIQLQA
jgi:fucose permease